jgi:starch phosphorylase
MAKLVIKLINDVASVINNDPDVKELMRVVFLADYRVSLAERIIPASDLSEQISTAGTEASGTGNMKFALNGALTIGTLDGANVEIREQVGADNFFLFGKTVEEIETIRATRAYNPWEYYNKDPDIKRVMDLFREGFFNLDQHNIYMPIWDALLTQGDQYFNLADFRAYVECQERVDAVYRDEDRWTRMCIMNIANMGKFSSDRAIKEYADDIWHLQPCPVRLPQMLSSDATATIG